VWTKKGEGDPRKKYFRYERQEEGQCATNWWGHEEFGHNQAANDEMTNLFHVKNIFSNPKPTSLLRGLYQISNTKIHDIILDFFAGSATTAHAVMDLNKEDGGNRKFICVQLPEPTDEKSEAYKAGYSTIAEISKERIRRAAAKIKAEQNEAQTKPDLFDEGKTNTVLDLGFRVFKLQKSNFKVWDANTPKDPEAIQQALELHIDHIDPHAKQEAILFELLLKSGFELTTPIKTLHLADKTVYSIADEALLICLDKSLTPEVIKAMAELNPSRVICLDEGFQDNDQLKTNAVLIMKSHGVNDFRTV
jgi:adenine-specific DNA-methyltransferase